MSNPKIDKIKTDFGYENITKDKLENNYNKTTRYNKNKDKDKK